MNPDPEAKASVRMTVTTTGIILNMLVVLVLEEVYGAIAVWLTELGDLLKTGSVRNSTVFGYIYIGKWCFYEVVKHMLDVFSEPSCVSFKQNFQRRQRSLKRG